MELLLLLHVPSKLIDKPSKDITELVDIMIHVRESYLQILLLWINKGQPNTKLPCSNSVKPKNLSHQLVLKQFKLNL